MRNLWRATTSLFWQHPVLWLPVLIADLLAFCLGRLQHLISHQIALWMYQSHTVLTTTPNYSYQPNKVLETSLLSAPFVWGAYFFSICLYTSALLTISRALHNLWEHRNLGFRSAISSSPTETRRILGFSSKLLGLCFVGALLLFPVSGLLAQVGFDRTAHDPLLFGYSYGILVSVGIAFVITPASIRLLRPSSNANVSSEDRRLGRIAAILAVAVSMTLGSLIPQFTLPLWRGWQAHAAAVRFVIDAIASAVVALPYIPLFIAFALLARGDEPTAQEAEPSSPDGSVAPALFSE